MARHVALLRGINLGASRRMAMADLRACLEEAGLAGVRTHLQSGNVLLDSDDEPDDVARAVEAAIAERFGIDVDVIVRTGEEMAAVVAVDPLGDAAAGGSRYVVVFLPAEPDPSAVAALAERDFGREQFRAHGREVYVSLPDGQQRSPLMKAIADGLGKSTGTYTVRNWNTVTKLAAMAAD
jgi:uncharacterized protein (DUF1697 family)